MHALIYLPLISLGALLAPEVTKDSTLLPKLIVVLEEGNDWECDYDVSETVWVGNPTCVTRQFTIDPHVPPPLCDIEEECGPERECHGSFKVKISINNWAQCCPNDDVQVCLNGAAYQTLGNGSTAVITVNAGGTDLACQPNSDSVDLPSKIDTIMLTCGTSCAVGLRIWEADYKEYCYACPAGGEPH